MMMPGESSVAAERVTAPLAVLGRMGATALEVLQVLGEATLLLATTIRHFGFRAPDRARLVAELRRIGTSTLPIAALLSLFVGMVLVMQTADQVREVSQGVLGPIVGLAMTKELGPTMMAFLLAGRAGSAIAAELGAMAVYEEVAALRTLDVDPVRFLVQPRLAAATLALPILVLYADFIGIAGGAAVVGLDPAIKISVDEYLTRMLEWVHLRDVLIGLGKGAVFGLVAALLPCTWGLRTRGGADRIATSTTSAVVWSFVLILAFDFIIVRATFVVSS
ncbi:MAG: MlaE family ABC transporter permease [Candidatus Binatia bacterium]